MPYGNINVDTVTTTTGTLGGGNASIMKNRIINGAMVIDQRNAGASKTITDTAAATYTLDRWASYGGQASKFSVQQNAGSVTLPVGFTNYYGVTSLSAYSVGVNDIFDIRQPIEGYNIADLGWGTANAKTVTLSFWVRSSLTGTFGGALSNNGNARSYPFTYSISSANTWEQKSITIAGDTSGTWLTTNGIGLYVFFGLGIGSTFSGTAGAWASATYLSATGATSVVGTNGATFYITGVQLEVGSSATGFEYVNYQTSLANCQRYCVVYGNGQYSSLMVGIAGSGTLVPNASTWLPVEMRSAPSVASSGSYRLYDGTNTTAVTTIAVAGAAVTSKVLVLEVSAASGLTQYRPYTIGSNNDTTAKLTVSAEL